MTWEGRNSCRGWRVNHILLWLICICVVVESYCKMVQRIYSKLKISKSQNLPLSCVHFIFPFVWGNWVHCCWQQNSTKRTYKTERTDEASGDICIFVQHVGVFNCLISAWMLKMWACAFCSLRSMFHSVYCVLMLQQGPTWWFATEIWFKIFQILFFFKMPECSYMD